MHAARCICLLVCLPVALVTGAAGAQTALTPKEQLGKLLFFDTNLSSPAGQSCATCHDPSAGYADPNRSLPVSKGATGQRVGNRNSPTSAYAAFSPAFHFAEDAVVPRKDPGRPRQEAGGEYVGGQYWDGRAATAAGQAGGPFVNPLEMNNPSADHVVRKVERASYAELFRQVYGGAIFADAHAAFAMIGDAIAAYELSHDVNVFTSKYDAWLRGDAQLNARETLGRLLFEGRAGCSQCHVTAASPGGSPPLFTNFRYANTGVPRNPANPFYALPPSLNPDGDAWIDYGLGGVLGLAGEMGKMKVPTLRNAALTAPYGHNGCFATLREVVEFYNTRDRGGWPAPEVPANVDPRVGDLSLNGDEIDAIVAFLGTLTDGWAAHDRKSPERPRQESAVAGPALTISPNPFNPTTRIEYTADARSGVRIGVYDVQGRLVRSLVDETAASAGVHAVTWDGRDARGVPAASGVYFIRVDNGTRTLVRKAVLAR